jgi:hypothetical protein
MKLEPKSRTRSVRANIRQKPLVLVLSWTVAILLAC